MICKYILRRIHMKKIFLPILLSFLLIFSFSSNIIAEGTSVQSNLIPVMTSNDAPLGHVTASSVWSSQHQPFNLFNGVKNDGYGWASMNSPSGWVAYEFDRPVVVNQYALWPRSSIDQNTYKGETPKNFTFDAWDGENWIVLHSESDMTDWKPNVKKVFNFINEKSYIKYRLNILSNNGLADFTALGELEMFNTNTATPTTTPTTTPIPTPTATPTAAPTATSEIPSGDRAILIVTLTTGFDKEFDLSMSEINAFLNWYDSAAGVARYGIDKHENNKGPFSKRTEYVIHDKILTFEVSEYSTK